MGFYGGSTALPQLQAQQSLMAQQVLQPMVGYGSTGLDPQLPLVDAQQQIQSRDMYIKQLQLQMQIQQMNSALSQEMLLSRQMQMMQQNNSWFGGMGGMFGGGSSYNGSMGMGMGGMQGMQSGYGYGTGMSGDYSMAGPTTLPVGAYRSRGSIPPNRGCCGGPTYYNDPMYGPIPERRGCS